MENEITRQPLTDEKFGLDDSSENSLQQDPQEESAEAPEEERSPTADATGQGAADELEAAAAVRPRSLKLVLTLQPDGTDGYRAILAVGAEDCDPVLRSVVVAGITEAVDQIPALVAEAEARWRLQPRYPATAAKKAPAATPLGRAPKASQGPARVEDEAAPTPAPGAARTDQLPLFG